MEGWRDGGIFCAMLRIPVLLLCEYDDDVDEIVNEFHQTEDTCTSHSMHPGKTCWSQVLQRRHAMPSGDSGCENTGPNSIFDVLELSSL